jgi:hypothetical protein
MDAGLMPAGLEDLLADKTPKERFDALTGPRQLWWRYCRGVVRAIAEQAAGVDQAVGGSCLQQLSGDEEHLRDLLEDQATSVDASRSFMESFHMIAEVTRALAGGSGEERREVMRLVMRYWARSGLLVPAPPGPGPLRLGRDLSAVDQ